MAFAALPALLRSAVAPTGAPVLTGEPTDDTSTILDASRNFPNELNDPPAESRPRRATRCGGGSLGPDLGADRPGTGILDLTAARPSRQSVALPPASIKDAPRGRLRSGLTIGPESRGAPV